MYQKVIIVGNLGRDPELRYTPSGSPVTTFSLACNQKHKDDVTTLWFRVSAWGSTAEACNQYLSKGSLVLVEGALQCDHATGGPKVFVRNDGTAGANFEVTANIVKFLGSRRQEAEAEQEAGPEPEQEELPF